MPGTFMENVGRGAKSLSKISSELLKIAKLKIEKSNLENELENNMIALGKFMYLQYKDGEDADAQLEIERLLAGSKELEKDIAAVVLEIEKLMPGQPMCNNCLAHLPNSAVFCHKCGTKLTEDYLEE